MAAPFSAKRSGWQAQAELQQHWPSLDLSRVCAVGCVVDVALSAVSYPLWHLKTREQVLGRGCAQHFRELLHQAGWRGFYRGALFGTFALLPGHCVWYLAYEGSKWHLTPFFPERTAPAAAAAVAECCYVACAMPVENVVVRIQCRKASAPQLRWGASLQELRRLWQEGGLRRWWNGSLLGLATSLPQSAIWWMVYENSKSFLLPGTNEAVVKQRSLGAAGAAVLASLVTTFLLNPLDVMKSQVQAASSSSQVPTAALKQSFSKLFLSGLAPRPSCTWVVPHHQDDPGCFAGC